MSRDPQRLTDYLGHVLQAIDRIERYAGSIGEDEFLRSELIQDAVIRNLEVVGEASRNIDLHFPEFAASHPELLLAVAYQMRNSISHGYFKVDLGIVWRTLATDLHGFRAAVLGAVQSLASNRDENAPR